MLKAAEPVTPEINEGQRGIEGDHDHVKPTSLTHLWLSQARTVSISSPGVAVEDQLALVSSLRWPRTGPATHQRVVYAPGRDQRNAEPQVPEQGEDCLEL